MIIQVLLSISLIILLYKFFPRSYKNSLKNKKNLGIAVTGGSKGIVKTKIK
jgi:hypothetical protein